MPKYLARAATHKAFKPVGSDDIQVVEMVAHCKVKITVLRRFKPSEVFKKPPVTHNLETCVRVYDGQEFIVGEDGKMPEGFCTSAWVSIYPNVRLLRFGGNYPWFKENGVAVNCCMDGLRPVIFKLERMRPATGTLKS